MIHEFEIKDNTKVQTLSQIFTFFAYCRRAFCTSDKMLLKRVSEKSAAYS